MTEDKISSNWTRQFEHLQEKRDKLEKEANIRDLKYWSPALGLAVTYQDNGRF